jgi:2-methylisocitrate lyase-like PEP mutase family enzyme
LTTYKEPYNLDGMTELTEHTDLLRSLHVPGNPLVLPNAWDVATAKAVEAAGFPVVATTSGGVAEALGYHDHHGAPADEMLAQAARIVRGVDVPVTVDAEAGYGMDPAEVVAALRGIGAAGCNLEDTDHAKGELRDTKQHAGWLQTVRQAADEGYGLVINARVDVFLAHIGQGPQSQFVDEALERARAYVDAGVDCVYPIALVERDAIAAFIDGSPGPVNLLAFENAPMFPELAANAPSLAELGALGAARVSYASFLYRTAMQRFAADMAELSAQVGQAPSR